MPRRARHYISGQPYHIVQRGINFEPVLLKVLFGSMARVIE